MADNRNIAFAAAKKLIHDFIFDLDYETRGSAKNNVCTYTHQRTNFANYLKEALDKVGIASVLVGDNVLEVNYDKSDKDKILAITNESLGVAYDSARGRNITYAYQLPTIKEPIVEPIKVAPHNVKKKTFYMEKIHQPGMLNYNFQFKYKLSAKDLDIILPHYDKKHRIKIFKNGTAEVYAQEILKRRLRGQAVFNALLNEDTCLAAGYVSYLSSGIHNQWPQNQLIDSPIYSLLEAKLKEIGRGRKTDIDTVMLDENYLKEINIEIKKILQDNQSENFLDQLIAITRNEKKVYVEDVCIDKDECIAEILQIQKTLMPGKQVGYMFTGGHNVEGGHFEAVIITPDSIIRPIVWGMGTSESMDSIPGAYHTEITSAIVPGLKKGEGIRPQVTGLECGTLGIAYIKELLKDGGNQLNQFSLSFTYFDENNKPVNFFLPSPQPLRYSQSSKFNKVIAAMVDAEHHSVEIEHHDNQIKVNTLRQLLERSIEIANTQHNFELVTKNQKILNGLSDFSQKWQAAYKNTVVSRDRMNALKKNFLTDKVEMFNHNLAYKSTHMERIATGENDDAPAHGLKR